MIPQLCQLRLQNFKCFEDQSFQLKPLTLLTGLNGTGKSSVLQSLLLLRQSKGLSSQVSSLMLKGDLVNIGMGKDALFEGAKEDIIGFDLALKEGIKDATIAEWRFKCDRETDVLDDAPLYTALHEIYYSSLFTDDFHYLHAERIGPRLFFEAPDFLVRRRRQLGSRGEYTAYFLSIFGDDRIPVDNLSHEHADSLQLRDQVEAWLGEISPGTRIKLTPNSSTDAVNLQYSFVMGKQVSRDYRTTNVGFGITYSLPILVAVLSSDPGSLLLIENPEAHLHPKGQAQMGNLFALAAYSGIQVIIETHSDHILNGIRVAVHDGKLNPEDVQLHFFQRQDQDGRAIVVSPQLDRDGRIDQWPDGFFDEWDNSLEALLEPRDK